MLIRATFDHVESDEEHDATEQQPASIGQERPDLVSAGQPATRVRAKNA
jgi:hypothetical protein